MDGISELNPGQRHEMPPLCRPRDRTDVKSRGKGLFTGTIWQKRQVLSFILKLGKTHRSMHPSVLCRPCRWSCWIRNPLASMDEPILSRLEQRTRLTTTWGSNNVTNEWFDLPGARAQPYLKRRYEENASGLLCLILCHFGVVSSPSLALTRANGIRKQFFFPGPQTNNACNKLCKTLQGVVPHA
jgi:hypothetical protein